MTRTHLVDRPAPLPDTIAAREIEVLDDVKHAHTQPATFVARLLFQRYSEAIVELCERLLHKDNWIGT